MSPLMAQSGHSEMSHYLSAFRGKADIAPARNDLGQPGAARSCGRPAKAMMSYRARSLRANVAGSAWIFEAADGFRKHLLRQPEHDLRKEDHERDRDQENAIDWRRRPQGLRKS